MRANHKKKAAPRQRGGATMLCPHPRCGKPTRVLRTTRVEGSIKRLRHCQNCGWRGETTEVTS
jgi:transcriptional regulator NrdR family protein